MTSCGVRHRKNARMTLAGEAFLPEVARLLKLAENARHRAHSHRAGFSPRIAQEASHTLTRLGLVAAGFGVHMVHSTWDTMPFPGIVYVPIDPTDVVTVVCFWRRSDRELLANLVKIRSSTPWRDLRDTRLRGAASAHHSGNRLA
jgi:DNA-binding transcriptional LysR family regulator